MINTPTKKTFINTIVTSNRHGGDIYCLLSILPYNQQHNNTSFVTSTISWWYHIRTRVLIFYITNPSTWLANNFEACMSMRIWNNNQLLMCLLIQFLMWLEIICFILWLQIKEWDQKSSYLYWYNRNVYICNE